MTHTYLAFDLGASSGRAIIGKITDGKLHLDEVHRFVNGSVEGDGTLYWDFPALCEEIKTGLRKALAIAPEISSIAIDTWGVDYVLFNQAGEAVRLPYHYRDSRTDGVPEEVFSLITEEELYGEAGIQLMQLNTVYQLYAHKQAHPEDFTGSTLLFMPDALTYMLCGVESCEYSIASTSNMLNAVTGKWSEKILTKLGIPQDILPEIVDSCTQAGTLTPEIQQELGCSAIPVVKVGAHDTASAVAAVPAPNDRAWAYLSCGTWALLGAETDKPLLVDAARKASFTNEGGVGGKIRFLSNIMGSWLFQEIRRNWNAAGRNISFMEMEKLAQAAKPLQFIVNPNHSSFLAPDDMKNAVIAYCRETGQGEITDDGTLLRSVYDSLVLCFRMKLEQMQQLVEECYQCLNIVGGGTKDRMLMQLSADCLGIPVVAGPVEATAIGNIIGQAIAEGSLAGLEAGRELVKTSFELDEYMPDPEYKTAWDAALEKFITLP
ncbi:MAG: rhamnulokinase [Victivallaceae bacterium]|nr:rhamnulokinase [Victivallaceae bacterium]